jgi:hypothetical protein
MGEDRLEMSQKERDRLKVLIEAKDELITQNQAAGQLKLSERPVRRLVQRPRQAGDRAVLHGLRGKSSNRKIGDAVQQRAIAELRDNGKCHDFGPGYACEHLRKQLDIQVGKDTVRKWMIDAGLWQARKRKVEDVHQWRERRSCRGELVQWDTSVHDWLEGRGERIYLIAMIDDASSHVFARFASNDTAEENMRVLWAYLEYLDGHWNSIPTKQRCSRSRPNRRRTRTPSRCQQRRSRGRWPNSASVAFPLTARRRPTITMNAITKA